MSTPPGGRPSEGRGSVDLLAEAYAPLVALADRVEETEGWVASALPGWTVRDLLFHLATDCQRALVALATPASGLPDTDEVTYWSSWRPGTAGAQAGLRSTRIIASAWSSVRGPANLYAETARAVLVAARRTDLDEVVLTQGRRITVASLLHTLAVEAGVHHLDLSPVLPEPPVPRVLGAARHVVDWLLGPAAPASWDDLRCVEVGTGRAPLSDEERVALGPAADRIPVFG